MNLPLALLVEHDWIDQVNAASTLVIAAFTVLMFFVVLNQLRTSKDTERSWVMPKVATDDASGMLLCEGTSTEYGKTTPVTTTAFVSLTLTNDGRSPVWVRDLYARLVLLDSVEKLPKKPKLTDDDKQNWYPAPFADGVQESIRLQLTAKGSQVAKGVCVIYGRVAYLIRGCSIFRKVGMFLLPFAGVCASTVLASAQTASSPTEIQASSSPVAYVYVSNYISTTGNNQVNAYAASVNGTLIPVSGSPFPDSLGELALNGGWLFGVEATGSSAGQTINSYSIASNGTLTLKNQTVVKDSGGGVTSLLLDHTGSSLYVNYYTVNDDCLSYSIDQSNGALTYLSIYHQGPGQGCPMSFIGNNEFAYSSSCYHFTPIISGAKRSGDGTLSPLSISPALPTPPPGTGFCPYRGAAADPSNHVAVAVTPVQGGFGNNDGATQLAVYTADSSGNLTTKSTYQNMPKTAVVETSGGTYSVNNYRMSPSGKLLAVAGPLGLQVFQVNGGNPITHTQDCSPKTTSPRCFGITRTTSTRSVRRLASCLCSR